VKQIFSKETLMTTGTAVAIFGLCFGAIWWAATVTSDLTYVKRDVAEIKAVLINSSPHVSKK